MARIRTSQQQKILEVLENSLIPMDVENVRAKADLKNWESTKAILLEMVLQGSISGQKTTKSWVYWADSSPARSQNNLALRETGSGMPLAPRAVKREMRR